jgi:hypothetical protein
MLIDDSFFLVATIVSEYEKLRVSLCGIYVFSFDRYIRVGYHFSFLDEGIVLINI